VAKAILTHCKRGHERSPENLDKHRTCKECERERGLSRERKEYEKKRRALAGYKERQAKYDKNYRQSLLDCYVAAAMHLPVAKISPEMIELKRNKILMSRALRELKKAIGG
jgi:hypothetical protein